MGQVMGLLQGKIVHDTFVVIDSFPLPVEGTETRVNVMEEANVFMFEFLEKSQVRCTFLSVSPFLLQVSQWLY